MESLEAQTEAVKATFQTLANDVIDSQLISSILKLSKGFLELIDTGVGPAITRFTLLTGVLTGGITIFGSIAGKLVSMAKAGTTLVSVLTGAATGFGTVAAAALPVAAVLALVATGIYELYKYEKNSAESIENVTTKLKDCTNQLQTTKEKIEELKKQGASDNVIDLYTGKLDKLQEKIKETSAKKVHLEFDDGTETRIGRDAFGEQTTFGSTSKVNDAIKQYKELAKAQEEASSAEEWEKNNESLIEYTKSMQGYIKDYEDAVANGAKFNDTQSEQYFAMVRLVGSSKDLASARIYLSARTAENSKQSEILSSFLINEAYQAGMTTEDIYKLINSQILLNNTNLNVDQKISALKQLASAAGITQSAIENVLGARSATMQQMNRATRLAQAQGASGKEIQNIQSSFLSSGWNELYSNFSGNKTKRPANPVIPWKTSGTGKTGGTGSSKSQTDKELESLKNIVSLRESELSLMEERGDSDKDQIAKMKQIQVALHKEAQYLRAHKGSQADINALSEKYIEYRKKIQELIKQEKEDRVDLLESELSLMSERDDEGKLQIAQIRKIQAALHNEAQYLRSIKADQKDINALSKKYWEYTKKIADIAKAQAESKKSELESTLSFVDSYIDKQITALEESKESISDSYDVQIKELQTVNDTLSDQLNLQEKIEALAEAKSKRKYVFKNGKFQYTEDIDTISKAQAELDSVQREQEYNAEVKRLQDAKDEKLAALDEEIKGWKNYKQEWQDVVDNYSTEQDRLIAVQTLGANLESNILNQRLSAVREFAAEYGNIMETLAGLELGLGAAGTMGTGTTSGGVYVSGGTSDRIISTDWASVALNASSMDEIQEALERRQDKADQFGISLGSGKYQSQEEIYAQAVANLNKHALGTTSSPGGMSLVGEKGAELRVLNQGDGVIPADVTRNLWSWGMTTPAQMFNSLALAGAGGSNMSLSIANVNLPNVSDAQGFVSGLKNLAVQYASKRK